VRFYLDVSCLNRPFDDQWQERIRLESEAIALILARCAGGKWRHVSSIMAAIEIAANPDEEKQRKASALLPEPADIIALSAGIYRRAEALEVVGFHAADAVHIAAAEAQGADVFLTCDDRLLRRAWHHRRRLAVEVANPLAWVREQRDAKNT